MKIISHCSTWNISKSQGTQLSEHYAGSEVEHYPSDSFINDDVTNNGVR